MKKIIYLFLLFLFASVICGCGKTTENVEIYTDKEFIQDKFPDIGNIKSVKYYYYYENGEPSRLEIGMYPKRFGGIIEVEGEYAEKIEKECDWEKCKKKLSDSDLPEVEGYDFWQSDDFDCGGEYITESVSFVGDFYYDRDKQVIYFSGGY